MTASANSARSRARQWSKTAWGMALVFGSLPVVGRLVLGDWEFDGAAEIACVLAIAALYFHFRGKRAVATIPDAATMFDQASQLAASGQLREAVTLLTETIELTPKLWQAFQYRGQLRLQLGELRAVDDFSAAIGLAPEEGHLYLLRGEAYRAMGDEDAARRDFESAAGLGGQ